MIDLHVHSSISDGSYSPTELIQMAKDKDLTAIALTDHDSIDGLQEARKAAQKLKINFINGIELSVSYGDNRLIHILGIDIDPSNKAFLQIYDKFRDTKERQIRYVIDCLSRKGIEINQSALYKHATGGKLDRQSIAKWLVANDYAPSITRAWIDIIDKVPYSEGELIAPKDAFKMIAAGGGYSYLAHYHKPIGLAGYSYKMKVQKLQALKKMGLNGIEAYYPSFEKYHYEEIEQLKDEVSLMSCGGTDFHGVNRPLVKLGIGEGDFEVPDGIYENLLKKRLKVS